MIIILVVNQLSANEAEGGRMLETSTKDAQVVSNSSFAIKERAVPRRVCQMLYPPIDNQALK
jgi:hypothetical protein